MMGGLGEEWLLSFLNVVGKFASEKKCYAWLIHSKIGKNFTVELSFAFLKEKHA